MKTLTIANQKGGVGKSTLTLHLAHFAHEQGLRVLVVDLDPQGDSSSALLKAFPQSHNPSVRLFNGTEKTNKDLALQIYCGTSQLADIQESSASFNANMASFDAEYDLCIIDTAPTASILQIIPVEFSDYVVSPIELQNWSYEGSMPFLNVVANIRERNHATHGLDRPKFLGLLPSRVWTQSSLQQADLLKMVGNEGFAKNLVMQGQAVIRNRQAYILAGNTGLPIWHFKKNSSARAEGVNMKFICRSILELMGVEWKVAGGAK